MRPVPWWPRRGCRRRGAGARATGPGWPTQSPTSWRSSMLQQRSGSVGSSGAAPPVGVGAPGMVDREGRLRFSPNLPQGQGVDWRALIGGRLAGRSVVIENDANFAMLAEHRLGAAKGYRHVVMVTLGTGIGGGLVVDGKVQVGAHGFAGEIGHMVVDPAGPPCPCGRRGCWERYASGGGLGLLAREAALAGALPGVVALSGGDPESVRGEDVTGAALSGDADARRVVEEVGWWVGFGLANLACVLDPECFVLGVDWRASAISSSMPPGAPTPNWSRGGRPDPRQSSSRPCSASGPVRWAPPSGGGREACSERVIRTGVVVPTFRDTPDEALEVATGPSRPVWTVCSATTICGPSGNQRPALAPFPILATLAASVHGPDPRWRALLRDAGGPCGPRSQRGAGRPVRGAGRMAPGRVIAGLGTGDRLSEAENLAYGIPSPGGRTAERHGRRGAGPAGTGPHGMAGRWPAGRIAEVARGGGGAQPVGRRPDLVAALEGPRAVEVTWGGPPATDRRAWPPSTDLAAAGATWVIFASPVDPGALAAAGRTVGPGNLKAGRRLPRWSSAGSTVCRPTSSPPSTR